MHDPSTVAFDIKRPWPIRRTQPFMGSHWYWPTLITIWHEDPETDGSDDSCGWSYVKLTKQQTSDLDFYAGCEAREPWYLGIKAKLPDPGSAQVLLQEAILIVGRRLGCPVPPTECRDMAFSLLAWPHDNIRSMLCYLPGWHSNSLEDREEDRRERALALFCCIARHILTRRRRWYQHPRWHLHHWRIQIQPLQNLKRTLFSRCSVCGKRFRYGYAPTTGNWHGTGPLWFKSEEGIYHSECFPGNKPIQNTSVRM